jgi:hypothetical protein
MESSTTVVSTQKYLPAHKKSGHLPLPLEQDAAQASLTKIETVFSNLGLEPNKEVTAGLLALVLALLTEPMLTSDAVCIIVSRAKHLAEQLGVSEAVWNDVFSQVYNRRNELMKGTPWGDFMG